MYISFNEPRALARVVSTFELISFRVGVKKKWYFWVVPTTKWPTPLPLVVVKVPLFCGKFFICLESPDTEK